MANKNSKTQKTEQASRNTSGAPEGASRSTRNARLKQPVEQVFMVPIADLKQWAGNPRVHSEEQIAALIDSVREYGWTQPIQVQAGTNYVIAGHGRIQAAERMGLTEVPVLFRDMTEAQAKAYRIADNQLGLLSGWDRAVLAENIQELAALDVNLKTLAIPEVELEALKNFTLDFLDEGGAGDQPPEEEAAAEEEMTETEGTGPRHEDFLSFTVPVTEPQHAIILRAIKLAKLNHGLKQTAEALTQICRHYLLQPQKEETR